MGDGVLPAADTDRRVGAQPRSRHTDSGSPLDSPAPGVGAGMVQPGSERKQHDMEERQGNFVFRGHVDMVAGATSSGCKLCRDAEACASPRYGIPCPLGEILYARRGDNLPDCE